MRDLVTPFAPDLKRLETDEMIIIPEARIREIYNVVRIGKSVKSALARQLPKGLTRDEVIFLRANGNVMIVNPNNAPCL